MKTGFAAASGAARPAGAMSVKAWAKFFCFGCSRERPLEDRLKRGARVMCGDCAARAIDARNGFLRKREVVEHEPEPIPTEILDAYRESREGTD